MAAATEFERVSELAHKMADDLAKSDKSARGIESAFSGLFRQLVGAEVVGSVVKDMIKNNRAVLAIQQAISGENVSQARLLEREIKLTSDLNFNEGMRRTTSGYVRDLHTETIADLKQQLNILQKQKVVAAELAGVSKLQLGFMGLMIASGREMWLNSRQLNQSLIEAGSSYENRDRLLRQTLLTQVQLGSSFDETTKAAAALVHFNLDASETFEDNLRLIVQMEQGLGANVQESAKLASIIERQLKGSFKDVSNIVGELVDSTSLAADESVRLATNIATALGRLRPGMAGALPEVVRLVGRYESALKEVGGQSGAFQQLLTQLTTPEGIVGAGALGVSPEFLATSQGVQSVMDRFAQYGEMLVGQSQGFERQMRLQALAQIFNVTTDQANQMLIAIKRANDTQMAQISIQDRWKEQLNATNSGVQRLGNSLMGLLQGAMYPVVFIVGALANRLADAVQWIMQFKEVVYILGAGVFVATVALTFSLVNLARALWQTVMASVAAQAVMTRYAALQGASALAGAGRFSAQGVGFMLGRSVVGPLIALLGTAVGFLAIIAALVAVPAFFSIKMVNEIKRLNDENAAARKIILTGQEKLHAQREAAIYNAARYSDDPTAVLMKQYGLQLQGIVAEDISAAQKRQKMAQARIDFDADVLKARVTRGMFTPLVERSEKEQKVDNELRDIGDKTLDVNKQMEKHMIRRLQQEQERLEDEKNEAAKRRVWNTNPLRWFVPGSLP